MPETPQSLTLIAKPESLGPFTDFVRKGALEASLPEPDVRQLELLLEEILVNIWRYGYPEAAPGPIIVTWSIPNPGEIALEVGDQGVEFNPLTAVAPNLTEDLDQRPVGGLGIFLLKSFAKSLHYRRQQGWNHLTFEIVAKS